MSKHPAGLSLPALLLEAARRIDASMDVRDQQLVEALQARAAGIDAVGELGPAARIQRPGACSSCSAGSAAGSSANTRSGTSDGQGQTRNTPEQMEQIAKAVKALSVFGFDAVGLVVVQDGRIRAAIAANNAEAGALLVTRGPKQLQGAIDRFLASVGPS